MPRITTYRGGADGRFVAPSIGGADRVPAREVGRGESGPAPGGGERKPVGIGTRFSGWIRPLREACVGLGAPGQTGRGEVALFRPLCPSPSGVEFPDVIMNVWM